METRMLSIMSRADKEIDRNYSKLLYRTSSAINNALRMVYASKPTDESGESYENWLQMEKTMLNSRDPLLDALSYGNDIRRELALKNLSANCKKPANQRGVFGDKLTEMVHEEYELNKLFNEAAFQKNNFQNQTNFHLSLSNHPLRAPTRTKTGIFPLVHNYSLKIFSQTLLQTIRNNPYSLTYKDRWKNLVLQRSMGIAFWNVLGIGHCSKWDMTKLLI
ncbi:unnamed protein product [Rhizophagus irregularis]|nr:unnamed protein product [Rhizophagus irregularis]